MRLAEFIRNNVHEISAEWEKFAGTLLPEQKFDASVLRNSIEELLERITKNMDQPQSDMQQSQKSEGKISSEEIGEVTEKHVVDRIAMGLSSKQLISEFRALRATVIRLWVQGRDIADKTDLYDLTRFNEVIDEALTEAEVRYSQKMDQSRELFLGILGHDLRTPLGAISGSGELILHTPQHERNAGLAKQILASSERMANMINDLIELSRVTWGRSISINPVPFDMRELCIKTIGEIQAAYPEHVFTLDAKNDLYGEWDELKLSQVLSNLLANAIQHGYANSEIKLTAKEAKDGVEIQIHNQGPVIPEEMIPKLFERFVQGRNVNENTRSGGIGLGLYIAKTIVMAHGGTISAQSSTVGGTTFTVYLPRTVTHANLIS